MSSNFLPRIIEAVPENLAKLTFENALNVETGNEFASHQIKTQPEVSWDTEPNKLYTLLLVDAVSTTDNTTAHSQICNWMVVNIPGNNVLQGQVLIEYNAPTPLTNGNSLHHLILLIFKQTDTITTENFIFQITRRGRIIVTTNDYRTRYSLGFPVAGNYYKVKDDEVTVLNV